ncbi:WS_DGAT_C domain-containing protein [Caerostris darwini]|uniref:WS_DGAT_C domain-containing protein n=1 Tax=Caerostris darwini TaxID=1538125 RepID=A0AAV4U759_9ARAC|nr:WS_DGAT_C domain-containing protein [Caerostris darwini]
MNIAKTEQLTIVTVARQATVVLANVPGPEEVLTLGSQKLKKILFWMSPSPEIPVVFSVISYAGALQLSVSADKMVVSEPQLLVKYFHQEIKTLTHLLKRRRIPGEHRRRSHFTEERRLAEIINPPDEENTLSLRCSSLGQTSPEKFSQLERVYPAALLLEPMGRALRLIYSSYAFLV